MDIDHRDGARRAYDALAPFYDDFVRDHDTEAWAAALESLARQHGLRGRRALDLGCGTGKSLAPLLARSYFAAGCDVSAQMLRRARRALPEGTPLHSVDARALPRLGCFDLIWCLSDGLNYIATDQLVLVFSGVARNLSEEGVLVFDVNTLWCYRRLFSGIAVVSCDDHVLVWEGSRERDATSGAWISATLTVYAPRADGFWSRIVTTHHQQHHPELAIVASLAASGLQVVGAYGAMRDGSLEAGVDEDVHSKAVYVARRCAPARERG
jgi:SAM-dependent methyltransferase